MKINKTISRFHSTSKNTRDILIIIKAKERPIFILIIIVLYDIKDC